jgi:hypothetical protein
MIATEKFAPAMLSPNYAVIDRCKGDCILVVGLSIFDVDRAEAKAPAGAPEHEIEVTPEMIEAGADVILKYTYDIYNYNRNLPEINTITELVFLAMDEAKFQCKM